MKDLLIRSLAVGAGGFVGTISRFLISTLFKHLNYRFPLGTLFINVTGSFILGWFVAYAAPRGVGDALKLAIGVGFVGGYTTFSTYMFETNQLAEDGAMLQATVNLVGSLILGLVAVRLGILLARWS